MAVESLEADIRGVLDADEADIQSLLRLAGLDPHIDIRGADLRGMDLSKEDLRGLDLSRCDMRHSVLDGANLTGVNLQRADLSFASLKRASLVNARLQRANLSSAVLTGASLDGAMLVGANLQAAEIEAATFAGADLRDAILTPASAVEVTPSSFYVDATKPRSFTETVDGHVALRLKQRRMSLGFTQQQLADLTGLTCNRIRKHETGRTAIDVASLFYYAIALGVDEEYFFKGLHDETSEALPPRKDLLELARSFSNIRNDKLRELILLLSYELAAAHDARGVDEKEEDRELSGTG